MNQCTLPASGPIDTLPEVVRWVDAMAARLSAGDVAPYKARVWPYRRGAGSFISCDIDGGRSSGESITFKVGGRHDFDDFEPTVPDAAEALHMIGLLAQRVGAEVQLGR